MKFIYSIFAVLISFTHTHNQQLLCFNNQEVNASPYQVTRQLKRVNNPTKDLAILCSGLLDLRKLPIVKGTVYTLASAGVDNFYYLNFSELREELAKINMNLKLRMNLRIVLPKYTLLLFKMDCLT